MVVSLVHTSLGSSYLIAHVLHPRAQLCIRYCSNKHTHSHRAVARSHTRRTLYTPVHHQLHQWTNRLSVLCDHDGWFLQPQRRPARLPRRTIFSHCICRCNRMRARLPLNTYSSSTHRFPDERNPIEATPLSATSAELCSALGLELELGSHSSSHVPSHAPLLLATLLSHNIPFPRDH